MDTQWTGDGRKRGGRGTACHVCPVSLVLEFPLTTTRQTDRETLQARRRVQERHLEVAAQDVTAEVRPACHPPATSPPYGQVGAAGRAVAVLEGLVGRQEGAAGKHDIASIHFSCTPS